MPTGASVNWVIKLSKMCNLRCGYCYEWNELGDRQRMSAILIDKVLVAAEDLHRSRLKRDSHVQTILIAHGGEPLVLPIDYLRNFIVSTRDRFAGLNHKINAQSNLFSVSDAQIELLRDFEIGLGVSYDVVPGVRLTVDGRESERRVERNIHRVRQAGIELGAIVVVAKHTIPHLRKIYDRFASDGMSIKVLPLSDGPDERPLERFSVSFASVVSGLCDLFDHWFASGLKVALDPFREYMKDAIRHLLHVRSTKYDRRVSGDYAVFVNTDGRIYAERDIYEVALALGDLNEQSMSSILTSPGYEASLVREAGIVASKCPSCPLNGSCSGWPISSSKSRGAFDDPCAIAPAVISHIARRLTEWGFAGNELRSMLTAPTVVHS